MLVQLDRKDHLVRQEMLDLLDRQGPLVLQANLEDKVHWVQRDLQVMQEPLGYQVTLELVLVGNEGLLVLQVLQDLMGHQDLLVHLELLGVQELLGHKGNLDQ